MYACFDGAGFSLVADTSLMIWQLFRREHFFRGSDNNDQLLKIMKVLGSDGFDAYLKAYDIPFETDITALLHSSVACETCVCTCLYADTLAPVIQGSLGHVLLLLRPNRS